MRMNKFLVTCVLFHAVTLGFAACPFKVKVTRIGPCKNNENSILEVPEHPPVVLNDACQVILDDCVTFKEEVRNMSLFIRGTKNGMPALSLKAPGCGFKTGKFEVNCPLAKGSKLCAGQEKFNVPGGFAAISLVVGRVGGVVDVITDKGTFCYQGEGVISRA